MLYLCCDAGCFMLQQDDVKKGQPWQRFDRDRDLQARVNRLHFDTRHRHRFVCTALVAQSLSIAQPVPHFGKSSGY